MTYRVDQHPCASVKRVDSIKKRDGNTRSTKLHSTSEELEGRSVDEIVRVAWCLNPLHYFFLALYFNFFLL